MQICFTCSKKDADIYTEIAKIFSTSRSRYIAFVLRQFEPKLQRIPSPKGGTILIESLIQSKTTRNKSPRLNESLYERIKRQKNK